MKQIITVNFKTKHFGNVFNLTKTFLKNQTPKEINDFLLSEWKNYEPTSIIISQDAEFLPLSTLDQFK